MSDLTAILLDLDSTNFDQIRVGDVINGAEDLGPVRSVRLTHDGYDNLKIYGELGSDILGLPSQVVVLRQV